MKKKTATITFHNAMNMGAVLQAYALQQAFFNLDIDNKVIDYRNDHITRIYSSFHGANTVPGLIKVLINLPLRFRMRRRFNSFASKNIEFTKAIKNRAELAILNDEYDSFFVGSDQVWSPYHTGTIDDSYFLDFVKNGAKKKSYAASFGLTTLPDKYRGTYSRLLSDFESISVREQSGADLVKDLTGKTVSRVLDPVFLLDRAAWMEHVDKGLSIDKDYLFLFCVNSGDNGIFSDAVRLANTMSLKVIYLSAGTYRWPIEGVDVRNDFTPKRFLQYLEGASYVVTDSFHATAFSVIFQKDFSLKVASQHGNVNNRSIELMSLLGIDNRMLDDKAGIIDWVSVSDKLDVERARSLEYLRLNA